MKILFLGDSITDGGRDKDAPEDLGSGYVKFASAMIMDSYPDNEFEFLNLGVSGYHTLDLKRSLASDLALADHPDIISIMLGINDVGHRYRHPDVPYECSDEEFEANYRIILDEIKASTDAKILLLTPYLLDSEDKECWREEVERLDAIVLRLSKEQADGVVPLHTLFADALKEQPTEHYYSEDGVHPNAEGALFIGEQYLRAVVPLIEGEAAQA